MRYQFKNYKKHINRCHLETISLPKGLTTLMFRDLNLYEQKGMCFYFILKGCYKTPIFKNYRKRFKEFAELLQVSESTIRRYFKELKKLNLAYQSFDNNHIQLLSYNDLIINLNKLFKTNQFKIKYKAKPYKITIQPTNCLQQFQAITLNENLKKQEKKIKSKLLNIEIQKKGPDCLEEDFNKRLFKAYKKQINYINKSYEMYRRTPDYYIKLTLDNHNVKKTYFPNPIITLSCHSISKLLGNKTAKSGSIKINKLVKLGFATTKPNYTTLFKILNLKKTYRFSYKQYIFYRNYLNQFNIFTKWNNGIPIVCFSNVININSFDNSKSNSNLFTPISILESNQRNNYISSFN